MRSGFALVPGDRAREGLLYIRSILDNFLLPSWRRFGLPLKINKCKKRGNPGRLKFEFEDGGAG